MPYLIRRLFGAFVAKQLLGYNGTRSEEWWRIPGFSGLYQQLKPGVHRLPGGTVANHAEEIGDVDEMVAMMVASGKPVLWVANLYSGTVADCKAAIDKFIAAGVHVACISLSNEVYLKTYEDVWPTPADYIAHAKAFRDELKLLYPRIPIGVPIAPSAAMKDPDSSDVPNARLAEWRAALLTCTWADYWELHAYAAPGQEAELLAALSTYANQLTKPIILGEWSVKQPPDDETDYTANRLVLFAAMITYLRANKRKFPFATVHNLMSFSANGYNMIRVTGGPGVELTALGQGILQYLDE